MNKKQFLSRLMRRDNHVEADKGQECLICKEEFGMSSTNSKEVQIRLPCNAKHTVGSKCIATWLKDHNTCPICRYEFFPAEEKEKLVDLYLDFLSDDDTSDPGEDSDEDFDYEEEDANAEDENMSEENESTSDEDDDMSNEDSSEDEE